MKPRRSGDGSYPLDSALDEALTSYEVSFSLMHQPLKVPVVPLRAPTSGDGRNSQARAVAGAVQPAPKARVAARARLRGSPFPSSSGTRAVWRRYQAAKLCALILTSTETSANASLTHALASMCALSASEATPLKITGSD